MARRAPLAALLAAVVGVSIGSDPSSLPSAEELALAADNECSADVPAVPGRREVGPGARRRACALSALQLRGHVPAGGAQAPGHDPGPPQLPQPPNPGAVGGEELRAARLRRANIERRLGSPLDSLMLGLLSEKLPAINAALHQALPGFLEDAYTTTIEKRGCCAPSPWGCWCHCTARGVVHVANLSGTNSLTIRSVGNVSSRIEDSLYTVRAEAGLTDLACAGALAGSVSSCVLGPVNATGGLSFAASMRFSATITGRMLPGPGDSDSLCFKITDVALDVPGSGVEYKRIVAEVGSWKVLRLTSHFWVGIVNSLPTNYLAGAIARVGRPALVEAVGQEDLCIG